MYEFFKEKAKEDTISSSGRHLLTASTVYLLQHSLTIGYFACMEVFHLICSQLNKSRKYKNPLTFLTQVLFNFITGLLCDLLWSDPDKDTQGWGENERGVSYTFGPDYVQLFCKKHDLDLICRAHQVVEEGYEFFAKRMLVTVFSAPNYCG